MATQNVRVHAIFKVKSPEQTRLIVLDTQDLSLGRSPENDLAIDEPEMSRKHAVFVRTASGCRLDDLGTSNGTYVNGERIAQHDLTHGDKVRIGEVEITYAQTAKNPASLGPSVEYASQLKSFGSPMEGQGSDGEATMLGVGGSSADDDDEAFEIQAAGDFDLDLNAERPPGLRPRARNLDEDIDADAAPGEAFDFGESIPTPVPATEPEPDPVWELDEDDVAAPASAPSSGRISLTLEIDGAEGELGNLLRGLAGKELELPKLRVKVKAEDLD